jgi:hypothetical protein
MTIAAAQPDDLPAIRALLAASGLPEADLTSAHLGSFWVLRDAAGLAAVVGLEPHGRARGYAVIARDAAPPAIRAAREFADLCPASAVCMTKRLGA